jgi:hypothetical protein
MMQKSMILDTVHLVLFDHMTPVRIDIETLKY